MGPRAGRQARGGSGSVPALVFGQAWQPGPDGPSAGPRQAGGPGWLGCGSRGGRDGLAEEMRGGRQTSEIWAESFHGPKGRKV
jgi:hypothetical protein